MKATTNNWQFLLPGLYAWIVTISFGATLLDILYANNAARTLAPAETNLLFSGGADLMLILSALTILTASGAIGSSMSFGAARNFFIASTIFVLVELLIPLFSSRMFQSIHLNLGLDPGPLVRLILSGIASILAFTGLWKLFRTKPQAVNNL